MDISLIIYDIQKDLNIERMSIFPDSIDVYIKENLRPKV